MVDNKEYSSDEWCHYSDMPSPMAYMQKDDSVKSRIIELFKPALETIDRQSNCQHKWLDKNGSAYFRCESCGYLADDMKLDDLITNIKLEEKGITADKLKEFLNKIK
jgi:rubrerythrin